MLLARSILKISIPPTTVSMTVSLSEWRESRNNQYTIATIEWQNDCSTAGGSEVIVAGQRPSADGLGLSRVTTGGEGVCWSIQLTGEHVQVE